MEGQHCLLIEDIVDTGLTMDYLLRMLQVRNPASLKVATLLDKPSNREVEVPTDYVGFTIPDEFVVGYGLDLNDLEKLAINSMKSAFAPYSERIRLIYDAIKPGYTVLRDELDIPERHPHHR